MYFNYLEKITEKGDLIVAQLADKTNLTPAIGTNL